MNRELERICRALQCSEVAGSERGSDRLNPKPLIGTRRLRGVRREAGVFAPNWDWALQRRRKKAIKQNGRKSACCCCGYRGRIRSRWRARPCRSTSRFGGNGPCPWFPVPSRRDEKNDRRADRAVNHLCGENPCLGSPRKSVRIGATAAAPKIAPDGKRRNPTGWQYLGGNVPQPPQDSANLAAEEADGKAEEPEEKCGSVRHDIQRNEEKGRRVMGIISAQRRTDAFRHATQKLHATKVMILPQNTRHRHLGGRPNAVPFANRCRALLHTE